jgi:molecular chaperone GrpE
MKGMGRNAAGAAPQSGENVLRETENLAGNVQFAPQANNPVEGLRAELTGVKDKLLRTMAEFENYKKRTKNELEERFGFGVCEAVKTLIPALENFSRAIASVEETPQTSALISGLKMVEKQILDSLLALNVAPIEAVGRAFDPNLHEAAAHIDDPNFGQGVVAQEISRGYIYGGKFVVKHSVVVVAN